MKKLLSIIVLGLLLSGCQSNVTTSRDVQKELIKQNTIRIGMSQVELFKALGGASTLRLNDYRHSLLLSDSKQYIALGDKHWITWTKFGYRGNVYLLEQKDESKQFKWPKNNYKNYNLIKIFENEIDFYDYILQISNINLEDKTSYMEARSHALTEKNEDIAKENKKKEQQKTDAERKEIEMAGLISDVKNTCKTLGFEEGTDKFIDCGLKLYTQKVDNKVAIEVAKQQAASSSSSSSSGTMTIYDPVRDRQNQIDRGMKMLSGGCTLGIDC
jgi:hypothetical protein